MPAILKPRAYKRWLDSQNQNTDELIGLLQNEIIEQFLSHPLPKQTGARHHIDPTRTEAAGKARQTAFVWPENKQTSDKG